MASNLENKDMTKADTVLEAEEASTWYLNALTEALGDLTLDVSDSLSVGRGSDNDVVLGSKQVSRNHALLSVLNGKLYVKDLDSSNGTFINDTRLEGNQSKHLQADDTLGFASFSFQVMKPIAAADDSNNVEQPASKAAEVNSTDTLDIEAKPVPVVDEEVADTDETTASAAPLADLETTDAQPAVASPAEPVVAEETAVASTEADSISSVDNVASASETDDPVVKETIIEEVLSSTEISSSTTKSTDAPVADMVDPVPSSTSSPSMAYEQETVMSNDTSNEALNKKPLNNESVNSEPVASEPLATEPTVHQQPATRQKPVVSPEHDKTTKTELQEEADPDVLRAKQAATAQFSGTANLGQSRDLGTKGNNAMDQAIDNPANDGYVEKKPSGGWFIWVFIAIIIIGLALWLFNMGSA
ncbi:FHA domain-containing protein [Psychrobacter sp. 72-O-c]|uniref:FHA domain-containing protein n=1 Tax=Psychrobacter sp. 72-O-c TaxID=2774125 RepID=UPI001D11F352|nr:FHA domain-containing protein [Psychrobacter sp. 72-O-c]